MRPVLRMSGSSLIQRHGISCCRVSVYGAVEATTSPSGTAVWTRYPATKPQKCYPNGRIQHRNPAVPSAYANGNRIGSGSGYRQSTHNQVSVHKLYMNNISSCLGFNFCRSCVQFIQGSCGFLGLEIYMILEFLPAM